MQGRWSQNRVPFSFRSSLFPRFNTLRPSSLLQIRCLRENRETAGCMQTWISKRLMARLIEYRRVINDEILSLAVRIKRENIPETRSPNFKFHVHTRSTKFKNLSENPVPEPEEKRKTRLVVVVSLFLERFDLLLFYNKFPLFISMMKRQYLSCGKKKREREKKNTTSLCLRYYCHGVQMECHSVQTYLPFPPLPPPPPSTLDAAGGIVQPEA